ncbi:MAG: TonB-dependent receptor, partial [Saprospiraceae bacterium]|nr:TonB-dependent receptor [Saprospiraceae bacterium]
LVLDGVRLNNAIYRNGHLQNSITVDPSLLSRAEVIFGPGSLIYGSDAIGGVVHFRTKDPRLLLSPSSEEKDVRARANAFLRYGSAARHKAAHIDVELGGRKWAWLGSFTYADFGDLRSGENHPDEYPDFGKRLFFVDRIQGRDTILPNPDPHRQRPSGYSQYDIMQKVLFRPGPRLSFTANFQYSNSTDIPRYDRLAETRGGRDRLRFARWDYGPQRRILASLKTSLQGGHGWYDRATIIGAYQRIDEDRIERRTFSPWRESTLVDVSVYSLTADFDKEIDALGRHSLAYGLDASHNEVGSEAELLNIETGTRSQEVNARYPSGGSRLSTAGAYATYRWRLPDSVLTLHGGIRFTHTQLFVKFSETDPIEWPSFYLDGISSDNQALTWSLGARLQPGTGWEMRALLGTAFRSPNIDDFAKIRENDGFITVPNPNLEPERALNGEISVGKWIATGARSRLQLSATGFYTRLDRAIVRETFSLPDGSPSFVSRGDTLFVQANINADEADIYGLTAQLSFDWAEHWSLNSNLSYTVGKRSLEVEEGSGEHIRVPQSHIPPLFGQTNLAFEKGKWSLRGMLEFSGRKKVEDYAVTEAFRDSECGLVLVREGTPDNIETAVIGEKSSPCDSRFRGLYGWTTFNFYADYELNDHLQIQFGAENLTDLHYRHFASGISAPGRNFTVTVRAGI